MALPLRGVERDRRILAVDPLEMRDGAVGREARDEAVVVDVAGAAVDVRDEVDVRLRVVDRGLGGGHAGDHDRLLAVGGRREEQDGGQRDGRAGEGSGGAVDGHLCHVLQKKSRFRGRGRHREHRPVVHGSDLPVNARRQSIGARPPPSARVRPCRPIPPCPPPAAPRSDPVGRQSSRAQRMVLWPSRPLVVDADRRPQRQVRVGQLVEPLRVGAALPRILVADAVVHEVALLLVHRERSEVAAVAEDRRQRLFRRRPVAGVGHAAGAASGARTCAPDGAYMM